MTIEVSCGHPGLSQTRHISHLTGPIFHMDLGHVSHMTQALHAVSIPAPHWF